ncbi:MAG: hypothetical protein ABUL57_03175, partial [Chloroflexota bacterium]
MADLAPVEARLRAIVDAYRDRLVVGSVYGLETLTRPGAKAHDFFAFVKPGSSYVSLCLKPVYTWPDLLDDISPALRKRLQGSRTAFSLAVVDEPVLAELEALVERAFGRYRKAGAAKDAPKTPASPDRQAAEAIAVEAP